MGGNLDSLVDRNIALVAYADFEQVEAHIQIADVLTGPVLADLPVEDCYLLQYVLPCQVIPALPYP